jgi:transglutaminase-like putative cysteine protease
MRSGLVLSFAALLAALSTCTFAQTQFKQPTPEELSMTTDSKAPGADAVYLNIEEVANDQLHYETFYARIKVLTEKGKDLATVEVPFLRGRFKVKEVKGRTIHADGKVIPLEGKPEDLLISKKGDREIEKTVFNLPSVEVGSIMEYRYQIDYDENRYSSPMWEVQKKYYVHSAHYQFTPFKTFAPNAHEGSSTYLIDGRGRPVNSLIWWQRLTGGKSVEANAGGYYTVDVTDVPPIPDEEYMPPIDSFLYKVFFYYKSAGTADEFWATEAKDWSKDVDKFAEQSKTIRDAVAGLVAPTDKEEDKAKKLYAAVEALDNTDYSRKKGESELKQLKLKEARHAEDTWKQKSGDSEDIAMLYLAMARSAGLTAYAVKVVSRSRGVFDVSYMDLDQLDDTLVLLSIDGKPLLVDPGEKMCPFGTANWRHSGMGGLRQSAQGPGFAETSLQSYAANYTKRIGNINIDAHGQITGFLRITMTGQEPLMWRQRALEVDEKELKKQFDQSLEEIVPDGVQAHVDHFLGLDVPESVLMAVVNLTGTLGTSTSKRVLLPGTFLESRQKTSFVSAEKRQEPVDMHYAERVDEEVTYILPDGFAVEGAPKDTQVPWQGHAVYGLKTTTQPGTVTVMRQFVRAFTQAKPEEYQDLRGFYQKVAAADQQQLVLTTSAKPAQPAKGN